MDDNSVGKWIVPAIGALTAFYFYKNSCDVIKVSDNSTNCTDTNANEILDDKCNEISRANEILMTDAHDVDELSIIETKDIITQSKERSMNKDEENDEKVNDDYETVTKSSLRDIKSTDLSQKSRWWY